MLPLLTPLDGGRPIPDANDVVAGWTGLVVIVILAALVAGLGVLLIRQLRRVDAQGLPSKYDPVDDAQADRDELLQRAVQDSTRLGRS